VDHHQNPPARESWMAEVDDITPTFDEQLRAGLLDLAKPFAVGDRVLVVRGPLAGQAGTVVTVETQWAHPQFEVQIGRDTYWMSAEDLTLDLTTEGAAVLAEPVGVLTREPGVRHPLSDTAGISALRRRVVRL
jgi:hypothetical protein